MNNIDLKQEIALCSISIAQEIFDKFRYQYDQNSHLSLHNESIVIANLEKLIQQNISIMLERINNEN